MNDWLGHLKAMGYNPGGQSLSLRICAHILPVLLQEAMARRSIPLTSSKSPSRSSSGGICPTRNGPNSFRSIRAIRVDRHLNRALTFGLYSLLRISQVFTADWSHFKAPDQLWVPGIKGQDGRWITLHPKALEAMGASKGVRDRFLTTGTRLPAFREAVYKKAKREKLSWRAFP